MRHPPIRNIYCIAVVSAFAAASGAQAYDWTYGADVGVGRSDNITLVPDNKISENMATADLDFSLKQKGSRLDDDLKGAFTYFDFLEHTYPSELIGRFDGRASISIVPERLTWTLQDDFGQGVLNSFGAQTPSNIENINSVSTGPDLKFRLGGTAFLDLLGRYSQVHFSRSPFDSTRGLGGLELGLQLSARSMIALNGSAERVLFKNTVVNTDFDLSRAYASYDLAGARTQLTAKLGATRVNEGNEAKSGPSASLNFTRQVSPASNISLSGGRDLTDASASFVNLQSGAINSISFAQAAVTANVYTITYGQLSWRYKRERTTFSVSGRWEKDAYDSQLSPLVNISNQTFVTVTENASVLDNSRLGGEFNLERQFTRSFSAQLLGALYRTEYDHGNFLAGQGGTSFNDGRVGAALSLREGRGLLIRLHYDHFSRAASGLSSGAGYGANVVFLTVGYRPQKRGASEDAP